MPDLETSLRGLLGAGTERLRLAGIPGPRREAIRLWTDLSGINLGDSLLEPSLAIDAALASRFQDGIARRARGEPLAHVTNRVGFRHLDLRSDSRALIPRPETEGLVDLLLQRIRSGRVADVGTGSGCLALSLATEGGFSEVVGIDYSAAALALARINCRLISAGSLVHLVRGNLCAPLRPGGFDALVSNPPYLTQAEYASLDQSVRDWEPMMALVSGEDGLQATIQLLTDAPAVLKPGGWLGLEVDCTRAQAAGSAAGALGWQHVTIHMDLFGRERYLLARRSDAR
jgi:release factor glutamine methyltransferase